MTFTALCSKGAPDRFEIQTAERTREAFSSIVQAVTLVADILSRHFPADATDNPNELPDAVIEIPRL